MYRFAIFILLTILSVSAERYCLKTVQGKSLPVEYYNGALFQISEQPNSLIAMTLSRPNVDGAYMKITISVVNNSNSSILFDETQISVVHHKFDGTESLSKTYSANDWLKKIKRRQALAAITTGLSQGAQTFSNSIKKTSSTGTVYTSSGPVYYTKTSTIHSDPVLLAQQQHERDRLNRVFQSEYSNAQRSLIKKNTLHPGSVISGSIISKFRNSEFVEIILEVGKDTHRFFFHISRGRCK